jgi:hypothetical protein
MMPCITPYFHLIASRHGSRLARQLQELDNIVRHKANAIILVETLTMTNDTSRCDSNCRRCSQPRCRAVSKLQRLLPGNLDVRPVGAEGAVNSDTRQRKAARRLAVAAQMQQRRTRRETVLLHTTLRCAGDAGFASTSTPSVGTGRRHVSCSCSSPPRSSHRDSHTRSRL